MHKEGSGLSTLACKDGLPHNSTPLRARISDHAAYFWDFEIASKSQIAKSGQYCWCGSSVISSTFNVSHTMQLLWFCALSWCSRIVRPLKLWPLSFNRWLQLRFNYSCIIVFSNSSFWKNKVVSDYTLYIARFDFARPFLQQTLLVCRQNIGIRSLTVESLTSAYSELGTDWYLTIQNFISLYQMVMKLLK